jgi:hypothetical protein
MISLIEAESEHLENWDALLEHSINGTIFHRLSFLSYHGERFKNKEKHLLIFDNNTPFAQISMLIEDTDLGKVAKSPYGGSYGGFVFQRPPSYSKGKKLLECFMDYLEKKNVRRFLMTPPIACCSNYPLDTFYFNLLEHGFTSINRDVSSVLYLDGEVPIEKLVSSRAKRMERKAKSLGVEIIRNANLADFWQVLDKTFAKHAAKPTHTMEEFQWLVSQMPDHVYVDVAYHDKVPIAGAGFFVINREVVSSFYLCQNPDYKKYQGLTLLIMSSIRKYAAEGRKYLDFGTSSVNMIARENVFTFKENFTKIGMFRESFEWVHS